ncbi:UNVERIFIED_CONTAM: Testican-2 [Gekko kuhli]
MRAPGGCVVPLLLALALAEGGGKEGESPGNFMEDEQWLSSIAQYSGKIKHWNRFRDAVPGMKAMPGDQSGEEFRN